MLDRAYLCASSAQNIVQPKVNDAIFEATIHQISQHITVHDLTRWAGHGQQVTLQGRHFTLVVRPWHPRPSAPPDHSGYKFSVGDDAACWHSVSGALCPAARPAVIEVENGEIFSFSKSRCIFRFVVPCAHLWQLQPAAHQSRNTCLSSPPDNPDRCRRISFKRANGDSRCVHLCCW